MKDNINYSISDIMGRFMTRILRTLGRIAIVFLIIAFIARGMAGVYRVAKLSWKGHLGMLVSGLIGCRLIFWVFGSEFDLLTTCVVLVIFSVVSEALVWAYESMGIYEHMTAESSLESIEKIKKNQETFFGMFSSLFIIFFIILGAYLWNGEDPMMKSDVTQPLKSLVGYAMLGLGLGLPIIGFGAYELLKEKPVHE